MRTNAKKWLGSNPPSIVESVEGNGVEVAMWILAMLGHAANDSATLSDGQAFYLKQRIAELSNKTSTPIDYSILLADIDPLVIMINGFHA